MMWIKIRQMDQKMGLLDQKFIMREYLMREIYSKFQKLEDLMTRVKEETP